MNMTLIDSVIVLASNALDSDKTWHRRKFDENNMPDGVPHLKNESWIEKIHLNKVLDYRWISGNTKSKQEIIKWCKSSRKVYAEILRKNC